MGGIRVLHVDDEPDFLELVASMLERERDRFTVETATTASEALNRLDGGVDCIVSDYEMPGQDGLELLAAVREEYPELPFILYTARGSESIASEAIAAGVTDYLEKGGETEQYAVLANRIENAVEQYRAERRAETVHDQLELALETTNAYTFDWRPDEADIRRYPTFEDVFGIDSETVKPVFDAFFEIVPPDHRDRVKSAIEEAIESGTGYDLTYPVEPGDDRIWVREQADVLTADEPTRVVGTVTDVTKIMEYERRLERKNERLDEFAEVISHDLRNPLNVAFGRAELLADECASDHTEPLLDALERMEDIVGNTLTLARQGDTVGETEPVPVEPVVEECTEMIDADAVTVEISGAFRIRGDPDRIRHVFENLLSNAVEYASADATAEDAPAEGGVTVRIDRIGDRGFSVADDGPGIPEDERAEIFEPGHTTRTDGTGLGLTIVERIAEAHGWDVSVTESREGGARFEFTGVDVVT